MPAVVMISNPSRPHHFGFPCRLISHGITTTHRHVSLLFSLTPFFICVVAVSQARTSKSTFFFTLFCSSPPESYVSVPSIRNRYRTRTSSSLSTRRRPLRGGWGAAYSPNEQMLHFAL